MQCCKSSVTCSKALRAISSSAKLVVVDVGGLVRSEMIYMTACRSKSVELTSVNLTCLGGKLTLSVSRVVLIVKIT